MKKVTTLVCALFITLTGFGQQNLFEGLSPYEGQEFKVYDVNYNTVEERFYIQESKYYHNLIISFAKNGANKPVGLNFIDAETNSPKGTYKAHHDKLDHYTQPAYAYSDLNGTSTYLMIDDIFFEIEKGNEDMSKFGERSGYGRVYVPLSVVDKKVETEATEEKKKVSLKDKLKNAMNTPIGAPLPDVLKEFKSREDFEAKINDYITAMRKKQTANPYTVKDKKEMAMMEKESQDIKNGIKKTNDDYWQSEEGQAVLNRDGKSSMKLYNNSGTTVQLIDENGRTSFINAGSTSNYKCSTKIYYCTNCLKGGTTPSKGVFIAGGDGSSCGKTITLK